MNKSSMEGQKMPLFFVLFLLYLVKSCLFLEVLPQNPKVTYINTKHFKYFNLSLRKLSRKVGVVINLNADAVYAAGNNYTASLVLMENLSGRYQPTAVQMKYKLCDWLYKDPLIGQMWAKYIKTKCPIRGPVVIENATIQLEDFPYHVPFTWVQYSVLTRMDVNVIQTDTKEPLLSFYMHFNIVQKEKKEPKKEKTSKNTTPHTKHLRV